MLKPNHSPPPMRRWTLNLSPLMRRNQILPKTPPTFNPLAVIDTSLNARSYETTTISYQPQAEQGTTIDSTCRPRTRIIVLNAICNHRTLTLVIMVHSFNLSITKSTTFQPLKLTYYSIAKHKLFLHLKIIDI